MQYKDLFYCSYRNSDTRKSHPATGGWRTSKKYASVSELLDAMKPYLTKHPHTEMNFLYETKYTADPK